MRFHRRPLFRSYQFGLQPWDRSALTREMQVSDTELRTLDVDRQIHFTTS